MDTPIFRKEALEHHQAGLGESSLLLVLPSWAKWTYGLLLGLVLASVVFLSFTTVSQYAEGAAVIRSQERVSVTASASSVIASVSVKPGSVVSPGDVLVSLYAADEEAQIAAVQRDFDANLLRMLADPGDQAARQAVAALRSQRDLFTARREERLIRAPQAGIVGDIRVRAGQSVAPGEPLLSVVNEDPGFFAVVMIPGERRPFLREGQPMRLELAGFRYSYQDVSVESVGDEIMGPQEVRRLLGADIDDALRTGGAVVVARARLPETFRSDGEDHRFVDGMRGTARIELERRRLIFLLIPGIKAQAR